MCLQPELATIGRSLHTRPAPHQTSPTPGHPNVAHQTPCRPPPRGPHRARQATQLSRLADPPRHRENLQTHNRSWNPTLAGTINLYHAPSFLSPGLLLPAWDREQLVLDAQCGWNHLRGFDTRRRQNRQTN
ncbi:hypothetical protein E2C01_045037 [Portunus trituberculatus]|uniref:Uncharacterized protein n=1 Tax=Portunus trituberculatus TaxID=210409 RepID=A0A5B7FZZ8_PORTR|nr:hypothetical protein [Portunus trituberculatus]